MLRYVDDDTEEIREDFIKFIECEDGTTGECIANYLLQSTTEMGIDMQNCRGQGYDAGGNMAGCHVGAAKRISDLHPFAAYFHCACHRLNLCVEQTCRVEQVSSAMEHVKSLTYFFNLVPKRNMCLEKHIAEERGEEVKKGKQVTKKNDKVTRSACVTITVSPKKYDPTNKTDSEKSKLIDVCRTRWVARIEGMGLFQSLLPPIVHTLDEMHANFYNSWSRDTEKKAGTHLGGIREFKFLVGLIIGRRVLDYLESITTLLQKRTNDVLSAYIMMSEVKTRLKNISEKMDEFHGDWYGEILDVARKMEIEESAPRQPTWSKFHQVMPANTHSEYWKRTVTIPMVTHLRTTLDARFNEASSVCAKALQIVPSLTLSSMTLVVRMEYHPTIKSKL